MRGALLLGCLGFSVAYPRSPTPEAAPAALNAKTVLVQKTTKVANSVRGAPSIDANGVVRAGCLRTHSDRQRQ